MNFIKCLRLGNLKEFKVFRLSARLDIDARRPICYNPSTVGAADKI
jgi:hypothetical protein